MLATPHRPKSKWSFGASKAMLPCPVGYGFEAVAIHLIREGQWREAIHLYREETGANLAQAEQAVERLALEHGIHRYSRGFMMSMIAMAGGSLIAVAGIIELLS